MRLFAALVPPARVLDDVERFLEPRWDSDTVWRWTPRENWHITLAHFGEVHGETVHDIVDAVTEAAGRTPPLSLTLAGGGAFKEATRASVLHLGLRGDIAAATRVAGHVTTAGSRAGARTHRREWVPHLTVARTPHPINAVRWLQVLDTYESPTWQAASVLMLASHLGQGRGGSARYERVETVPLGGGVASPVSRP